MIEGYVNKKDPAGIEVEYSGDYIDVLAELIWLNFAIIYKVSEEHKLDKNELIKNVLEVVQENIEEVEEHEEKED